MEETGVANVADPLGGSWYVEQLTDRIEADAEKIFEQIKERGLRAHPDGRHPIGPITSGILRGIEDGWFTGEIAESAFQYQRSLEKGDKRVVGVNVHHGSVTGDLEILRVSHEVERDQVRGARGAQGRPRRRGRAAGAGRDAGRRARRVEHDRRRCWRRCAPRRPSARSAACCARSGAPTRSRPASRRRVRGPCRRTTCQRTTSKTFFCRPLA